MTEGRGDIAYFEGDQAAMDGEKRENNPYQGMSTEIDWYNGFDQATSRKNFYETN